MRVLISLAFFAAAGLPASAHHAFAAEFDGNKPVKLKGVVTRMEWINPHAWIHVDVTDDTGKVTSWMVECGSPNVLLRKGIDKTSVTKGMQILVDGYQAKDGSKRANGRDLTLADGSKMFLGSSNPNAGGAAKGNEK